MTGGKTFNWVPQHDPRSRSFPIRAVARTLNTNRRNKLWRVGPVLDQGREGACVGFGWAAEALSTPVAAKLDRLRPEIPRDPEAFAHFIYNRAKTLDPWTGEDYDGTSTLAGAKAMQSVGLLKEYRWAFSIGDVADAVLGKGPVVIGTYWYDDMYEAPNGILTPGGPVVGGHCYLAVGYRHKSEKLGGEDGIIIQNSWGTTWGENGLAVISLSNLEKLLKNDGEACVPYRRSYGYYKP